VKIFHFLGYSGSGKTSAISLLVKELGKSGKKVGILKHIHGEAFSIDRRGKDSWIYKRSGASTVITISASELVIIKNRSGKETNIEKDLENAFRILESNGLEYVFIEGFLSISKYKREMKQIICARDKSELHKLLKLHDEAICILASSPNDFRKGSSLCNIPILRLPKDKERLIQMIS